MRAFVDFIKLLAIPQDSECRFCYIRILWTLMYVNEIYLQRIKEWKELNLHALGHWLFRLSKCLTDWMVDR